MAGKRPVQNEDGSWTYPRLEEVLLAVGLKTIAHYVDVRHQTVMNFIINWPIYELCVGAVRKRGLPARSFWWDQLIDWDLVQEGGLWPPSQKSRSPVADNDNEEDKLDEL